MNAPDDVQFPCTALPQDPAQARLLGIYPQRQAGLFMQRIKVPGGRIRPEQWCGLAALAGRFTPEYPLHLTTRQDIELHGVDGKDLPAVQREIHGLEMSGIAACGDSLRNITACPQNGLRSGTWDVSELAEAMRRCAESLPWIRDLPRKFKISVSGCPEACARPWLNDLGLAANADGSFRAMLAGSLGPKPGVGLLLAQSLPVAEILPLLVATLRWFHAEGDREHRGRARLRHARQRVGDTTFQTRLRELFREEKGRSYQPEPALRRVETDTPLQARLSLPLGDMAPRLALELGEAVAAAGAELRLGLEHDLLVFGGAPLRWTPSLAALGGGPSVVACPGSAWCTRGIADSRAAATRIRAALSDGGGLLIAVAGCPNNCPLAAAADVGLIGRSKGSGAERGECFRLLAGGGKGCTPVLARELHPAVPAEKVHEAVALVVQEYSRLDEHFEQLAAELRRRYGD